MEPALDFRKRWYGGGVCDHGRDLAIAGGDDEPLRGKPHNVGERAAGIGIDDRHRLIGGGCQDLRWCPANDLREHLLFGEDCGRLLSPLGRHWRGIRKLKEYGERNAGDEDGTRLPAHWQFRLTGQWSWATRMQELSDSTA